jgi:hypothetical protein
MFYRWWNRYQAEGKDGFKEKNKGRPKENLPLADTNNMEKHQIISNLSKKPIYIK